MPFGLTNALVTFQHLLDRILDHLYWEIYLVYFDDILVIGRTIDKTIQRLEIVLQILRAANLELKSKKCYLFENKITYLGHVISEKGVSNVKTRSKLLLIGLLL